MGPYLDWFVALLLTELSLHGFLLHFVGAELFTARHRKFLCRLLLSCWVFWPFLERQLPATETLLEALIFKPINAQSLFEVLWKFDH